MTTDAARVLDILRVFSFLSQESVPTSGAFAVNPLPAPEPQRGREFHSA